MRVQISPEKRQGISVDGLITRLISDHRVAKQDRATKTIPQHTAFRGLVSAAREPRTRGPFPTSPTPDPSSDPPIDPASSSAPAPPSDSPLSRTHARRSHTHEPPPAPPPSSAPDTTPHRYTRPLIVIRAQQKRRRRVLRNRQTPRLHPRVNQRPKSGRALNRSTASAAPSPHPHPSPPAPPPRPPLRIP